MTVHDTAAHFNIGLLIYEKLGIERVKKYIMCENSSMHSTRLKKKRENDPKK